MEPGVSALDRYVLKQSPKRNPSVCFLATASGDADAYIARFYAAFEKLPCRPAHVELFRRTPDLEKVLLAQDVIYVGGGNTKSMLAVWREWGIPALLRRAWRAGTVLAGVSAGAICWFEFGVTDSWGDRLAGLPCLGLLAGTCCPHYDGEAERRPALRKLVAEGAVPSALALDDGAAAHFVERKLIRIVCSRPGAGAYRVRRGGARAVESALEVQRLPSRRKARG
ncbi:MAG: peptidase E [Planctomycetes bacterium]|nr:peptidase E [Planctomycetota bacterium]